MGYPTDEEFREAHAIGPSPAEIREARKKEYYECHVTLLPKHQKKVEPLAKKHKFKTSLLVGDEVMGDAKFLYCTSHGKSYDELYGRMEKLVEDLPGMVLRKKIEHVILDERYV